MIEIRLLSITELPLQAVRKFTGRRDREWSMQSSLNPEFNASFCRHSFEQSTTLSQFMGKLCLVNCQTPTVSIELHHGIMQRWWLQSYRGHMYSICYCHSLCSLSLNIASSLSTRLCRHPWSWIEKCRSDNLRTVNLAHWITCICLVPSDKDLINSVLTTLCRLLHRKYWAYRELYSACNASQLVCRLSAPQDGMSCEFHHWACQITSHAYR